MMEDLVLDGGHMPDAADLEDVGSEIHSMVCRYDNQPHPPIPEEPDRQTVPKQVYVVLYGILFIAVAGLITLWSVMF